MTLRMGEEMTPYGEMILPLLISMNSQARVSPGIKDNSTIAICRFCFVCPRVVPYVVQYFQQAPEVFPECFHNFVAVVASWYGRIAGVIARNAISNMELGQMMLNVLNGYKQSAGSEWESFYNQKVDIRFRQILRNNFNFYSCVC